SGSLCSVPGCRDLRNASLTAIGGMLVLSLLGPWNRPGEIRRIEIVFSGNPDQREQRIAPSISQSRTHTVRPFGLGDGADRPVRSDPFSRRMRKHGRQVDYPARLVDRGGLHGRDLMLTKRLAHDVEAA